MYGLVLEGGGAKGAYQVGAYYALKERGYTFDAIVGTSIGAVNGAFFALGKEEEAKNAWLSDIFPHSESLNYFYNLNPKSLISDDLSVDILKEKYDYFKKNLAAVTSLDLSALGHFLEDYISEDELRKSNIKYGLATFNLSDAKPLMLFLDDMEEGALKKYIIGSCSLPIFKQKPMDGKYYLDGAVFNALPFEMLQDKDLTPVIIRLEKMEFWDKKPPKDSLVIAPKKKISGVLEFRPDKAKKSMTLGYYDALKAVDNLLGEDYYIETIDEEQALYILNDLFLNNNSLVEDLAKIKTKSTIRKLTEDIYPKLARELGYFFDFTYSELLVALLEAKAAELEIEKFKVYTAEELLHEIRYNKDKSEVNDNKSILTRHLQISLNKLF